MISGSDANPIYTAKERSAHKVLLRARLAGVTKPRRLTTHFFWAQENKDLIKALKEEEGEDEEEDNPKENRQGSKKGKKVTEAEAADEESDEESGSKKKRNGLARYQALCKSEFEKLDEGDQREWKEMADLDMKTKSEFFRAITKGKGDPTTMTPEFRQQCVSLPAFIVNMRRTVV